MMSSRRWRSCGNIIRDEIGRRKIEGLNRRWIEKEGSINHRANPHRDGGLNFAVILLYNIIVGEFIIELSSELSSVVWRADRL